MENTITTERPARALLTLPVGEIAVSPDNTRLADKQDAEERAALKELAASIAAVGLQQPPCVRPSAEGERRPWTLVYGERRLRAVRDVLRWTHITVLVDQEQTREGALAATVVENMQRRDLHPMDEARGIALLRGQGLTVKEAAARLGRRPEWVKERLTLCDLPPSVQDLYRRSARITLGQALALHEYTHGGKDNTGFPDLIMALATVLDGGGTAGLGGVAGREPDVVRMIHHAYTENGGRWGDNFFDTRAVCTRCPFAAYRPGYYDGVGYCLLPTHYTALRAKGEAAYEAARAEAVANPGEMPATGGAWSPAPARTAAEKGKRTRARHLAQKASYAPAVRAIERAADMIVNLDGIDIATLCAYTLTTAHVHQSALTQVMTRHGLARFPSPEPVPSRQQIEGLRTLSPVEMVRYTLEALLVTQAERARDYDPGRTPADPVLGLYVPGQAVSEEAPDGDDDENADTDAGDEQGDLDDGAEEATCV